MMSRSQVDIEHLPSEVITEILSFLPDDDILTTRLVSRRLNSVVCADFKQLKLRRVVSVCVHFRTYNEMGILWKEISLLLCNLNALTTCVEILYSSRDGGAEWLRTDLITNTENDEKISKEEVLDDIELIMESIWECQIPWIEFDLTLQFGMSICNDYNFHLEFVPEVLESLRKGIEEYSPPIVSADVQGCFPVISELITFYEALMKIECRFLSVNENDCGHHVYDFDESSCDGTAQHGPYDSCLLRSTVDKLLTYVNDNCSHDDFHKLIERWMGGTFDFEEARITCREVEELSWLKEILNSSCNNFTGTNRLGTKRQFLLNDRLRTVHIELPDKSDK